ncbi:unnamed protein product, partial [marine sediment metagenome]
ALKLAKICEKVAKQGYNIAVAVQAADIYRISQNCDIPVLAQHIDNVGYGQYTGHTLAEAVKQAGAIGTLLNHSEHRMSLDIIKQIIKNNKNLEIVACAPTSEIALEIAKFNPNYIAIEPPALIGGNVSVSTAQPELITNTVNKVRPYNIPVLCGAGVKTKEDVKIALELGAKGILLASGVTKAKNPEKVLKDLVKVI